MPVDWLPVVLLFHDPIMRAKGQSRQMRGLRQTQRPTPLPARRPRIVPGRSIVGLGLIAALFLGGCAHQPYPNLDEPDPLARDLPRVDPAPSATLATANSQPGPASAPEALAADETVAQAPQKAKLPDPPDPATLPPAKHRRIEIRLKDQRFDYYEDNQMLWSGPISSGTRQHPTPRGRFRVQSKDIDKRSGSYTNSFNQPTPMPYSLQFHGPYFIHEGYLPDKPASHGCVRLRYEDAKFIFERMRVGDRVMVAS